MKPEIGGDESIFLVRVQKLVRKGLVESPKYLKMDRRSIKRVLLFRSVCGTACLLGKKKSSLSPIQFRAAPKKSEAPLA